MNKLFICLLLIITFILFFCSGIQVSINRALLPSSFFPQQPCGLKGWLKPTP